MHNPIVYVCISEQWCTDVFFSEVDRVLVTCSIVVLWQTLIFLFLTWTDRLICVVMFLPWNLRKEFTIKLCNGTFGCGTWDTLWAHLVLTHDFFRWATYEITLCPNAWVLRGHILGIWHWDLIKCSGLQPFIYDLQSSRSYSFVPGATSKCAPFIALCMKEISRVQYYEYRVQCLFWISHKYLNLSTVLHSFCNNFEGIIVVLLLYIFVVNGRIVQNFKVCENFLDCC